MSTFPESRAEPTEPPVFTKAYDALRWVMQETLLFPRAYRSSLVERSHGAGIDLLLRLTEARFGGTARAAALSQANLELDKLRVLLRLAKDLRLLSVKKYLEGAARLHEIGRMIGGWKKSPQGVG
jgi:hypothetical protein